MIIFGIILLALIVTTWNLSTQRNPYKGGVSPEGIIMLPEPMYHGISLDVAIMQSNLTLMNHNTNITAIYSRIQILTSDLSILTTLHHYLTLFYFKNIS